MTIASEDDVVLVRRCVRAIAEGKGFDPFALAAVTTAASELARNVWIHGGGGTATVEVFDAGGRTGVRMIFRDHGPGIIDLERVLQGGYSTAKSLGLGLSGSRRLVDDFQIETAPGRGTAITVEKWKKIY